MQIEIKYIVFQGKFFICYANNAYSSTKYKREVRDGTPSKMVCVWIKNINKKIRYYATYDGVREAGSLFENGECMYFVDDRPKTDSHIPYYVKVWGTDLISKPIYTDKPLKQVGDIDTCAICKKEMEEFEMLSCLHRFHPSCIIGSMEKKACFEGHECDKVYYSPYERHHYNIMHCPVCDMNVV